MNGTKIEAARKAVEELAHVEMNLPLEDWSRISSTILSALDPSACKTCNGRGIIGGMYRVGDGDVDGWEEPCPDCQKVKAHHSDADTGPDDLVQIALHLNCDPDADSILHVIREIQADLDSAKHADAGKVEGDGWLPIESAPKNKAIQIYIPNADYYGNDGIYAGILVDLGTGQRWATFGWAVARDLPPHMHPTHWRPLPSAPSEGAE